MLNYYSCYIPNVTSILAPLHKLLVKETPWDWSDAHEESWNKAKSALHSSKRLVHYSLERDVVIACDASPYGLGSVISHILEDGTERPISYASRTLSLAEKNYSQLDKEAAAVMFGVRKFHTYLYGRRFKIYTDHKTLLGLLQTNPFPLLLLQEFNDGLCSCLVTRMSSYIVMARATVMLMVSVDYHCLLKSKKSLSLATSCWLWITLIIPLFKLRTLNVGPLMTLF